MFLLGVLWLLIWYDHTLFWSTSSCQSDDLWIRTGLWTMNDQGHTCSFASHSKNSCQHQTNHNSRSNAPTINDILMCLTFVHGVLQYLVELEPWYFPSSLYIQPSRTTKEESLHPSSLCCCWSARWLACSLSICEADKKSVPVRRHQPGVVSAMKHTSLTSQWVDLTKPVFQLNKFILLCQLNLTFWLL